MGDVIDLFTGKDLDSDIIEDQIIGFWNCENASLKYHQTGLLRTLRS